MTKKLQINTTKSFVKGLFVMVFIFVANISFAQVLPPPPTFPPDAFELQGDSVICPGASTSVTIFKTDGGGNLDQNLFHFDVELNVFGQAPVTIYSTQLPEGETAGMVNPLTLTAGGTYTVTATPANVSSVGMGNVTPFITSAPFNLTFEVAPVLSTNATSKICPFGAATLFCNQSATVSYGSTLIGVADFDGGNIDSTTPIDYPFANLQFDGNNFFQATNECGQTSNVITIIKGVNVTAPTISIQNNPTASSVTICPGGSVTLIGNTNGIGVWTNGSTAPSITVTQSGFYSVYIASGTAYCNAATSNMISVNVFNPPAISGITTICSGSSTTLTASGGTGYFWSDGSNFLGTSASITVSPTVNTTYSVTNVTNGCSLNQSQLVTVNNCNSTGPQGSFPSAQCGYITNSPTGTMLCNATLGASGYLVKFYNVASTSVYAQKVTTGTSISFTGLTPALLGGTQYDVTVTPIMPSGPAGVESAKCRMGLIATQTPTTVASCNLNNPVCVSSAASAPVISATALLQSTNVPQATNYQFELTNTLTQQVILSNQTIPRRLAIASFNLMPGATYQVRIRATVAGVQAASFGPACFVKIAGNLPTKFATTANVVNEVAKTFNVASFPNPFKNSTTFNVSSENDEMLAIQLFDITGKVVFSERIKSNTNFEFTDDKLNSGIYFLQATKVDGSKKVIKVIKN